MSLFSISLLLFLIINLVSLTVQIDNSKNLGIKTISSCKAQLDDDLFIDLSSLDNPSKPRY